MIYTVLQDLLTDWIVLTRAFLFCCCYAYLSMSFVELMLHCAMLCCAMLRDAMLCYTMLFYAAPYDAIL